MCEKEERLHSTALSARCFKRKQQDEVVSVTAANDIAEYPKFFFAVRSKGDATAAIFLDLIYLICIFNSYLLLQGWIKIRGDKCWRDLTCMNYHYQVRIRADTTITA